MIDPERNLVLITSFSTSNPTLTQDTQFTKRGLFIFQPRANFFGDNPFKTSITAKVEFIFTDGFHFVKGEFEVKIFRLIENSYSIKMA